MKKDKNLLADQEAWTNLEARICQLVKVDCVRHATSIRNRVVWWESTQLGE